MAFMHRVSGWLGRLSVGRKLMLIYLLDLTAVIYVSGILIHEKYLAIDFARKEMVGTAYVEVVRDGLLQGFLPQGTAATMPPLLGRLEAVRTEHDAALHSAPMSAPSRPRWRRWVILLRRAGRATSCCARGGNC